MVCLVMSLARVAAKSSLLLLGIVLGHMEVSSAQQIVPITIVSIGDSYASGEGAPDTDASGNLWLGDNADRLAMTSCHRSARAAPAVASRLVAAVRPIVFHSFACSGHTMASLSASNGQIAILGRVLRSEGITSIDALIVSAGGNDIGFAVIVGGCLIFPCAPGILFAVPAHLSELAESFDALNRAILGLGIPVRHVFVTEYPDVSTTPFYPPPPALPPHGRCGGPTTLNVPNGGFDLLTFEKADIAARTVVGPLNAALAAFVTLANTTTPSGGPVWHFVSGISSSFHTHGYCMGWSFPEVLLQPHMGITGRMINTVADSLRSQRDISGTMHPNASGQEAAGAVIANVIKANVPVVTTGSGTGSGNGPEDPVEPRCPPHSPNCSRN
jgi:hypothetical protein